MNRKIMFAVAAGFGLAVMPMFSSSVTPRSSSLMLVWWPHCLYPLLIAKTMRPFRSTRAVRDLDERILTGS